jgi:site-specific DNA-methyltransferase (adenine-specific)
VIWGGNYFDLPPTRGVIVWDKMQPWENFSQVEIAWTSFDKPAQLFKYRNTSGRNKIHPTQKPICLYEWILNKYANKNDIILDTHVGSASSLIACYRTNHKFVGFEIDETYYKVAMKRLDAEMAQMNIFDFIGV